MSGGDELGRIIRRRAGTATEADLAADLGEAMTRRVVESRAFGRQLSEAEVNATLKASKQPTVDEFVAVGLSESDASAAARGLVEGTYMSFEDACLAKAIFNNGGRTRLNEALMRETAKQYQDAAATEVKS